MHRQSFKNQQQGSILNTLYYVVAVAVVIGLAILCLNQLIEVIDAPEVGVCSDASESEIESLTKDHYVNVYYKDCSK